MLYARNALRAYSNSNLIYLQNGYCQIKSELLHMNICLGVENDI